MSMLASQIAVVPVVRSVVLLLQAIAAAVSVIKYALHSTTAVLIF